ncbi:MAG: caspase family protein [Deltaproteobacteria bacterium]|nr:caspase family protein [Deltaproteobacteria bacterium]
MTKPIVSPPRRALGLVLGLAALALPRAGRAAPPEAPPPEPAVDSYAIIVGSNAGGAGQVELDFAEDDARKVAAVLRDLGGYDPRRVQTILAPTPQAILDAIASVETRTAADRAAGRQSVVFFYYSGHAKASALELGNGELDLGDLRARLLALPSTLTVVVLDACQSGAFSRVKGAAPAADFSFNSRTRLDAAGVAVMASSSENELSQESDLLRGSYFTHHLLVGLRGAGDDNHDGQVSLDEAYRYAYHQTLLATAATAVGGQHVSLEVDLKGQGEIALTYPARASARIELAAATAGQVVVEQLPSETVTAELTKVAGAPVRIAVAPGDYRVMIHHDGVVDRCPVSVASGATGAPGACDAMPEISATGKGGPGVPNLELELITGLGAGTDDGFTQRLRDFGYGTGDLAVTTEIGLAVLKRVHPYLASGVAVVHIAGPEWTRGTDLEPLRYTYTATVATGVVRAGRQLGPHTSAFAQAELGIARGHDRLVDETQQTDSSTTWSWAVGTAGGLTWAPWNSVGFALRASYLHAPSITNRIGDTHEVGGLFFGLGLEVRP